VDPLLPEGQRTVGTAIQLRHLAATPVGMEVTIHSELVKVDGRRLRYRVQARDEIELIADAEHERFIVDAERFEKRIAEKAARKQTNGV
jgi:predicted thioesterase